MKLVRRRLLLFVFVLQPAVETIPPLGEPIFWQNHKPSVPVRKCGKKWFRLCWCVTAA